MLYLLFQLGNDRYALEAGRVVEVVPMVRIERLPGAPRGVAGIFNYRGRPVPAVDLCELALGRASGARLSTRIIVLNCRDADDREQLMGLIAENATATLRRDPEDFVDPGLRLPAAPYLGPVLMDQSGAIRRLDETRLLPEPVRDLLFGQIAQLSHDRG